MIRGGHGLWSSFDRSYEEYQEMELSYKNNTMELFTFVLCCSPCGTGIMDHMTIDPIGQR